MTFLRILWLRKEGGGAGGAGVGAASERDYDQPIIDNGLSHLSHISSK